MWRVLLNASIAVKMMAVLVLVAVLFLTAILGFYLPTFERELLHDRRIALTHLVEVVRSLLDEYHQRAETGELTLEEAQDRAIRRISQLRYGKFDYFWINDTTLPFPRLILHPVLADLQGAESDHERFRKTTRMQYGQDGRIVHFPSGDKNLLQAFVEVATASGDGFAAYSWPRPTPDGASEDYFPKESYVMLFRPWNWVVGTGAYVDDIHDRIAGLRRYIFASTLGILVVAIFILSLFIVVFITRPMQALMRYAEKVSSGDLHPQVSGRFYGEAALLKTVITRMVDDLNAAIRQADARRAEARREAEKAQQLSDKLKALFTSMAELVALHELVRDETGKAVDYRITDCNQAYERATGTRREDIVGKRASELLAANEPPHLKDYARVAAGAPPMAFETYDVRLDRYFHISVASPGPDEFVTVATDITNRKRAEQLIADKSKELEQIVYVASHDLRTPLVNVDGYSRELEYSMEALQSAAEPADASGSALPPEARSILPEMADAVHHIRNSTRQMDILIRGLLNVSRAGRTPLHVGTVDMNALMAEVTTSFEYPLKHIGAELTVSDLPPCRGDSHLLNRVFTNLISNALKYLDSDRPGRIAVSGTVDKRRCVYCVQDNGTGIPPQHQERIFELFQRLDPERSEGEGLGLAIVRQIIGRLDGKVWVESVPGSGSRFFVSLPRLST
ncbi:MAG: PAS domain-containing protein [Lentisphaerae bacterium]|nr:PAS domain-containing protein [Lentisphaerota bacterium]